MTRQLIPAFTEEGLLYPAQLFVRGRRYGDIASNAITAEGVVVCGVMTALSPAASLLAPRQNLQGAGLLNSVAQDWQGNWVAAGVNRDGAFIITDHLGSWPVYMARCTHDADAAVYGTSLYDVARLTKCTTIDKVSADEFDETGTITSPFTLFCGVNRLWPGSWYDIDANNALDAREYWLPHQSRSPANICDAAVAAKTAIDRNLQFLLGAAAAQEPFVLMFSGGEDGRTLAAAALAASHMVGKPFSLELAIFLDQKNREYYFAKWAAEILGLRLTLHRREDLHYSLRLREMIRRCGPGIDVTRGGHAVGLLNEGGDQLHIDGFGSDSFLKALYLPVQAKEFAGLKLGLDRPLRCITASSTSATKRYEARRAAKRETIASFRDAESIGPWSLMWPLSDHEDYNFMATNIALRRSVSPFLFGNVISAIAGIGETSKVNRRLFRKISRAYLGWAGWVPRTDGEIPALTAEWNVVPAAINKAFFRAWDFARRRLDPRYDGGPWQSHWLLAAAAAQEVENLTPGDRHAVEAVLGRPFLEEHLSPHRLFRRIQLAYTFDLIQQV